MSETKAPDRQAAYSALFEVLSAQPLPETLEGIGLEALLRRAIDADFAYMAAADEADAPYDDDEAFEAIADPIVAQYALDGDAEQDACAWVDAYMEAMAAFLEDNGWVEWMT